MRLLICRLKDNNFFKKTVFDSLITERAFANNRSTPSHVVFATHHGGGNTSQQPRNELLVS